MQQKESKKDGKKTQEEWKDHVIICNVKKRIEIMGAKQDHTQSLQ